MLIQVFCEYLCSKCLQHADSGLRSSNTGSLNIRNALKPLTEKTKLIENIYLCLGLELEFALNIMNTYAVYMFTDAEAL